MADSSRQNQPSPEESRGAAGSGGGMESRSSPAVAAPHSRAGSATSGHAGSTTSRSPMSLRRRVTNNTASSFPRSGRARATTFRTVEDFDELEYHERPGWQPGAEPGFDPELPDGGHASMPTLTAPSDITVVDFSHNNVDHRHFNNQSFIEFLEQPQPEWAKCRWINVNGVSWDVLQAVGSKMGLHKLALEDVMNQRNRTKMDWYPNHAFIVMTLQKLVHLADEDDDDDDGDDDSSSSSSSVHSHKLFGYLRQSFSDLWRSRRMARDALPTRRTRSDPEKEVFGADTRNGAGPGTRVDPSSDPFDVPINLNETSIPRTLQRYHSSGNEARAEYMEAHSSLAPYKMAISAEQVSVFLMSDNTVISFFEASAADIERPILTRLSTAGTVLRESYDGSLLVQAIIDAIIDLAIPLSAMYTDIIGDLELDVLTAPSIYQSRGLYICISEINKMISFLNPIENLVNVLRDHKTPLDQEQAMAQLQDPASGVIVSPMTHTYLGDVLDHCIIITEGLRQLRQSSDNLISLIFNTISAHQNESMKQLTAVTIIFLPLTFITGFFGQNFPEEGFPEVKNGIWYFWACAVPTVVATVLILMRDLIYAAIVRILQRKHIGTVRKRKRDRKRRRQARGAGVPR